MSKTRLQVEPKRERAELDATILQHVIARVFHIERETGYLSIEHPVESDRSLIDIFLYVLHFIAMQFVARLDAGIGIEIHNWSETNTETIAEAVLIAQGGSKREHFDARVLRYRFHRVILNSDIAIVTFCKDHVIGHSVVLPVDTQAQLDLVIFLTIQKNKRGIIYLL